MLHPFSTYFSHSAALAQTLPNLLEAEWFKSERHLVQVFTVTCLSVLSLRGTEVLQRGEMTAFFSAVECTVGNVSQHFGNPLI